MSVPITSAEAFDPPILVHRVETDDPAVRPLRDAEALRLRELQLSYRRIAAMMDYPSPSSVFRAVQRAQIAEGHDPRSQRRALHSGSLEQTGHMLLELALEDPAADPDKSIRAATAFVKLAERLAKLWGLDAPTRRVIEHHVVTDEALTAEREMLRAELEEMGVDVDRLMPTVEDVMAAISSQVIEVSAVSAPSGENHGLDT